MSKIKLFKKDYMKPMIITFLVFVIITICFLSVVFYTQYQEYKYEMNKKIAHIVIAVTKDNPELEEQMIHSILEEEQNIQQAKELLARYGFNGEEIYFLELEEQFQYNMRINIVLIVTLTFVYFTIFITYLIIKDRKLKDLTKYLKKIQHKDYSLDIRDNTEGELSNLKNEIYKITVMLKEQASNLEQDKKALADSLSDISHQLKTPLTSISVMVDILEENDNIPEEKKREFLVEISRQLEWINWLVISLLKLSKLDAGAIIFKQDKIKVKELIETVVKNLSIPVDIKNQTIHITGQETIYLYGDFNWYVEALVNILKNCIEHTKEGKDIYIAYEENPLFTKIEIKDTGVGISKEDLPYIFKRFYKAKNSSKDSVGIGLALSKSIVESQGGDILVASEEKIGSIFTIKVYKK